MKKQFSQYQKWAITTWLITILALAATIKAESRLLIIAVIALAVFGYILWTWEDTTTSPLKTEDIKQNR
jgi:hypothetical protein